MCWWNIFIFPWQASLFTNVIDNIIQNDNYIINTTQTILQLFTDEYMFNEYDETSDAFIPETYMFAKKFILLTNFVSKNLFEMSIDDNQHVGGLFLNHSKFKKIRLQSNSDKYQNFLILGRLVLIRALLYFICNKVNITKLFFNY